MLSLSLLSSIEIAEHQLNINRDLNLSICMHCLTFAPFILSIYLVNYLNLELYLRKKYKEN